MAQDVHPELRDERGVLLDEQPAQAAAFGSLMAKLAGGFDATAFPLLAGIDPYGLTIFNDVQKPRLVDELIRYVDVARPEIQEDVRQLADFVRKQIDQYRVYIWFIGD